MLVTPFGTPRATRPDPAGLRGRTTPAGRRRDDGGFTLVEVIIAMGLFAVVLVVFLQAVRLMTTSLARTSSTAASTTQVRSATQLLGRQIGYASAANTPVWTNASWYLEFSSDAVRAGDESRCTQWRYTPATGLLQYRTWGTLTLAPTTWTTAATSVVNDPGTQPPFTVLTSDAGFSLLRVVVDLRVQVPNGGGVQIRTQYAVRNSSEAPVPSATAVCMQVGRP